MAIVAGCVGLVLAAMIAIVIGHDLMRDGYLTFADGRRLTKGDTVTVAVLFWTTLTLSFNALMPSGCN